MDQEKNFLLFENSVGWILAAFVLGILFAFLLYYRVKNPWSTRIQKGLAALRAAIVILIVLLIIGPYLKLIQNNLESPIVVFAIDNSSSIAKAQDSLSIDQLNIKIQQLKTALSDDNIDYESVLLSDNISDEQISFDYNESNLSGMLKSVENNYEGMNLGAVVLVSDGIYNNGISPTFRNYPFPIYSIGVGDTLEKKDALIKNLRYNKISYQGSKFPLIVELNTQGYPNQTLKVNISKNGKELESQDVEVFANSFSKTLEFLVDADDEGIQKISVEIEPLEGEFSYSNNTANAYVDVVEGKENILILSSMPHPDIKAIKSAIETNQNYSVDLFIPQINGDWNDFRNRKYDLIVLNQSPDRRGITSSYLSQLDTTNTSLLYILGSSINMGSFNRSNGVLAIFSSGNQPDNVGASFNNAFNTFLISDTFKERTREWPPIKVPFGNYQIQGNYDILLNQRLSSIVIPKPIVMFSTTSNKKVGLFVGEGIWKWKLDEYSRYESNEVFNELILKSVQYLSSRQDKRKFRVYPEKNEYQENETVVMVTEVYDDLYNPQFGLDIELRVSSENGYNQTFNYVNSENTRGFKIENLREGIYNYSAQTRLNNKIENSSGQFAIQYKDIESVNLTADFRMLRELSAQSGGKFYQLSNTDQFISDFNSERPPNVIHSSESLLPLINLEWLAILVILLISTEWFIRKYEGGY